MIRINPSGKFLMNFCYVNLWSYENKVSLLSAGNILDKLQFQLVKRRTKSLISNVTSCINSKQIIDFEGVLKCLSYNKKDVWDKLFVYAIINHIAFINSRRIKLSDENNFNSVLSKYLSYIQDEQNTSYEVLTLKLEKIKLQSEMDLLQLSAAKYS